MDRSIGRRAVKRHVSIMLLLVGLGGVSRAEQRPSATELRESLVGTWEVFKLPPARHVEGPAAFDPATQLGKKIVFSRDSFDYDKEFMFFPQTCRRAGYAVHIDPIPSGSIPSRGSLNFLVLNSDPGGFGPIRADEVIQVGLKCGGKEMSLLDFSRGGFLAIYWETGLFYLKKTSR